MENLIIFIIFIIFSALRSLAESRQKTGQRAGRPAGLPMTPAPRPPRSPLPAGNFPPEYLEVIFDAKEAKKQEASKAVLPPVQTVLEPAMKAGAVFNQEQLFQPQAANLLRGIVYAEVFGPPRAKKPWKQRK
ncbi:MAG: hypothetical protein KGZ41_03900 [Dethiobacter sp.]|jgi:hypothetical protein|nr:hypothetical protein [Dethiobacter sp.]MBS3899257.1 hypothetical protein [Dethiobacter sp.]MBS3982922.1 hypothetical protein [Dethiobacter sp.]MCL4464248.1 hypothetical protein [Bacillota bacterium]MCL5993315.1 hypothetical protein [Bacillota bacterium]